MVRCTAAGNANQAFHAAQTQGRHDDTQPAQQAIQLLWLTQLERQHAAKPAHLACRDGVVGMFGQAGIIDFGHRRMRGKETCQRLGILIVPLHAQGQCLQSTFQLRTGVRIEHSAEVDGTPVTRLTISAEATTTPAFTSLWPLRYLVALWMTASIPSGSGF